jgi:hypothetical protein
MLEEWDKIDNRWALFDEDGESALGLYENARTVPRPILLLTMAGCVLH